MHTNIQYEVTDTFCGEANYSWVKRALGWAGIRCRKETMGDMIALYPQGECVVCFISFHTFGNASKGL